MIRARRPKRLTDVKARAVVSVGLLSLACLCGAQVYGVLPGVALDENTAYAPTPGGGIQAINLTDGSIVWRSNRGTWALATGSGKVIVLTGIGQGGCSVGVLDAQTGSSLSEFGPIGFPDWVQVKLSFSPHANGPFQIWVGNAGPGGAAIFWRASRWTPVDIRHLNAPQRQQFASGRIAVNYARNAVVSRMMPVSGGPNLTNVDTSLPLLRGQKALATAAVGRQFSLALVSAGKSVTLQCFQNRMLKWSYTVGGRP